MRESFMPCYAPSEVLFTRGEGCYLITEDDDHYLDFTAGIAVNALGYAHPKLVEVLREAAGGIWHSSNLFRVKAGEQLAKRLTDLTFADHVFFGNSGAEANECGIKAMRRYHYDNGHPQRSRIIGMTHSFHGRTIATVAASGNNHYCAGFIPSDYHFDQTIFGDIDALKATITDETAGIILEPIQGEGGIKVADKGYLQAVRALCDEHGILLMFDEIQCGVARTGSLYAYQALEVTPDILSSAKGIGGGFPIGVCMSTQEVGKHMVTGTHGSTFGGNPLATTIANAVLDIVTEPAFLQQVEQRGHYLQAALRDCAKRHPNIYGEVSGMGLMLGMTLKVANQDMVTLLRDQYHTLVVAAGGNSVRFLPSLIVGTAEIDALIDALDQAAKRF